MLHLNHIILHVILFLFFVSNLILSSFFFFFFFFFLVIAKFKPEISEETRQEACNEVLKLKDQIPNILSCTAGKTFTDRSQGYEWGMQQIDDLRCFCINFLKECVLLKTN